MSNLNHKVRRWGLRAGLVVAVLGGAVGCSPEQAQALQNFNAQYQARQMQQQQMMMNQRPVQTNCQMFGNQMHCTSY